MDQMSAWSKLQKKLKAPIERPSTTASTHSNLLKLVAPTSQKSFIQIKLTMAPKRAGITNPAAGRRAQDQSYFRTVVNEVTNPENRPVITAVGMFAVSLPTNLSITREILQVLTLGISIGQRRVSTQQLERDPSPTVSLMPCPLFASTRVPMLSVYL